MSKLHIVATPIGNMQDITLRAIEVLKSVAIVLSESPQNTQKILNKYEIKAKQVPYRDENKTKIIPEVLAYLEQDLNIALTTDSGTPLISDPGFKLVREVLNSGHEVVSVPGPSAIIAALSISGLPTDKFSFVGFLPKKGGQRNEILQTYGSLDATLVLYESPYRIVKTLEDIKNILGNRYVCVAKEITKLHETLFYAKVEELLSTIPSKNLKGEFVIMIAKEGFEA